MTDFAFQIVGDASAANRAIDDVTRRLDKITTATEKSSKLISQKLADVGKGIGFQLVGQVFDKLKDSIGGISSAALSAGASGAAMGATFAGPWGAAIGGAIGLTKGLVSGLLDQEKAARAAAKAIEDQAKAYWDSVRAAKAKIANDEIIRQYEEEERQRNEAAQTSATARDTRVKEIARLQATISGLEDEISRLEGRGGLGFATPVGPGTDDEKIAATRRLRDAQLELDAVTKSYGGSLLAIRKAENERKDRIADLEQILGREALSQEEQKRLLSEINTLYRAGGKSLDEYNSELEESKRLHEEIEALRAKELRNMLDARSLPGFMAAFPAANDYTAGLNMDPREVNSGTERSFEDDINARADVIMAANGKLLEVAEQQKQAADDAAQAWANGLGSIAAEFANMAMAGEVQLDRLGFALGKLMLQIAAMQIGGPWGMALGSFAGGLSMPGHATGTQFMVGGSAGADQNIVAFRASGNERVTVETPDDVRTGRYMGGRAPVTQVIVQNDAREVVSAFGTRAGERQYARLNRKFRRD